MYAYGSIHWRALGIGETEIGALWAASVGTEIVFMVTIGHLGGAAARAGARAWRFRASPALVRWGAMMADPTGFWLWPMQGLHALTFAIGHLGAIGFITRAVPDRYAAAAQGATGAMATGGVLALGMALSAALYPTFGGRTYGLGVASSALGLALCLGARPPLARRGDRRLMPASGGSARVSGRDRRFRPC